MTGKNKCTIVSTVLFILLAMVSMCCAAEKPIIIGAPLSTAFLYGWDAERGIKLAVDEINAAGGVKVGNEKRPFKVDVIDTRDLEPGVPVSDALLAVEKLILEKKADFLIGGPVPIRGRPCRNAPPGQEQKDFHPHHGFVDTQVPRDGWTTA